MSTPRETALLILSDMDRKQAFLNIAYRKYTDSARLTPHDAAFVKELVYGVTAHRLTLDHILTGLSTVKLKKMSVYIRNILRLGLYQLRFLDKIPDSAAVNESVKLARRYGHAASSGFVNGVLRGYLRKAQTIQLEGASPAETLSLQYSHPLWLVEKWLAELSADETERLLSANNTRPPLDIRCNIHKGSRDTLAQRLADQGVQTCETPLSPAGLTVVSGGGVERTDAYKEGWLTVQDQSAQLPALALAPHPGDTVLDMCAAPGGKTTQLAELMQDKGVVHAFDIHKHRLDMVTAAAKRLGLSCICTHAADASYPLAQYTGKADKLLLDVPCSGLGILRRKPDIRYNMDEMQMKDLIVQQRAILECCAQYVKPGGELVYSTCTINHAENMGVIKPFLLAHPNFALCPVSGLLPELERGYATLYPHTHGGDGFFLCKLKRKG